MEPTFTNRELQFAEAVHSSLVRSYNIQGSPGLLVVKRYAQTLDLKGSVMSAILSQYFPGTQFFDVPSLAKFLRCVGNAQNGVGLDQLLQNAAESVRSKPIAEINLQRQQKTVQLQAPSDYLCDQSLQGVVSLAEQIEQTLSQLEEQDPTLPFLLSRESNQTIKKMLTDFTMQVKVEVDEIVQLQGAGQSDEAFRQLQAMVDEIQANAFKDLQELQVAYQKTISAEAELAKCAKVIETYALETKRLKDIIQVNDEVMDKNQRLIDSQGTDFGPIINANFLQDTLQLDLIHEQAIKDIQSPPDEKTKTPIRVLASGLHESDPDLNKEIKSVIHKKLDAASPDQPTPQDQILQQQNSNEENEEKQDDDFWQIDTNQESVEDPQ